jgi:hypothetical protein
LKMTTWTSLSWLTNWLNSTLWYKREFTNCNFWWFSRWRWLSWIFHPCLKLWLVFAWNFRTVPSPYWKVCIPRNIILFETNGQNGHPTVCNYWSNLLLVNKTSFKFLASKPYL